LNAEAMRRHYLRRCAALLALACTTAWTPVSLAQAVIPFDVVGDAVPAPLTATPGNPARGRAIVADRQTGFCLLCHTGPFPEERFQGNLAPDLSGAGARWSEGQLRLRIIDAASLNPQTIMPPYHRSDPATDRLTRVGIAWRAKPILGAQEVEDVVAFLRTLQK